MRVSSFTLFAAIAVANAKLRSVSPLRNLVRDREENERSDRDPFKRFQERPMLYDIEPPKVGSLHTVAFEKLSDIYAEKLPENEYDLMVAVGEVMSDSLCPKEDSFCDAFVYQTTLEEFSSTNEKIKYPEGFNKDIQKLLEATETTIFSLDEDNFEDVMDELTVIMDDIENMENVPQDEKAMAMASISVAEESGKLWYDVYTNPNHKLNSVMIEKADKINRRRRLDETDVAIIVVEVEGRYWDGILELIIGSIIADYFGAIRGGLKVLELIPKNPNLLWPWNWPSAMLSVLIFHSIPASARFALGTNSTDLQVPGF